MTITYLKKGKSDAARADDDAKTRAVVEQTLQDIETRGDTAVSYTHLTLPTTPYV